MRDIFQIIIYLPGLSRSDWGCYGYCANRKRRPYRVGAFIFICQRYYFFVGCGCGAVLGGKALLVPNRSIEHHWCTDEDGSVSTDVQIPRIRATRDL